jgi:hypothetical protein
MTPNPDTLTQLIDHYHEQDCRLSAIHARQVLDGIEQPEPFLLEDIAWWEDTTS